jgi:hypothetical protein
MQHYVRQMRSLEKCTRENDPDGSKVRQGGGMPSPASRTASCWPRPHPCGRCRVAGCATCCSKERQTLLQLRGGSISGSRWLCRRLGLGRWASASPRGAQGVGYSGYSWRSTPDALGHARVRGPPGRAPTRGGAGVVCCAWEYSEGTPGYSGVLRGVPRVLRSTRGYSGVVGGYPGVVCCACTVKRNSLDNV